MEMLWRPGKGWSSFTTVYCKYGVSCSGRHCDTLVHEGAAMEYSLVVHTSFFLEFATTRSRLHE